MREIRPSAGHLSVHVEGLHPADVPFLFERQPKRIGLSLLASLAFDVAIATLLILASRYVPASTTAALQTERVLTALVLRVEAGPGGGGGGGGNQTKEPPRQAELPGKDRVTVPVAKPRALEPPRANEPNPILSRS